MSHNLSNEHGYGWGHDLKTDLVAKHLTDWCAAPSIISCYELVLFTYSQVCTFSAKDTFLTSVQHHTDPTCDLRDWQKHKINFCKIQGIFYKSSVTMWHIRNERAGFVISTCQVNEDVAAVVREEAFGARRAGRQPSSQNSQEVLHSDLKQRQHDFHNLRVIQSDLLSLVRLLLKCTSFFPSLNSFD